MPLGQGAPLPWGMGNLANFDQLGQLGAPFIVGVHAGTAGAASENAGAEDPAAAAEEAHGGG